MLVSDLKEKVKQYNQDNIKLGCFLSLGIENGFEPVPLSGYMCFDEDLVGPNRCGFIVGQDKDGISCKGVFEMLNQLTTKDGPCKDTYEVVIVIFEENGHIVFNTTGWSVIQEKDNTYFRIIAETN